MPETAQNPITFIFLDATGQHWLLTAQPAPADNRAPMDQPLPCVLCPARVTSLAEPLSETAGVVLGSFFAGLLVGVCAMVTWVP